MTSTAEPGIDESDITGAQSGNRKITDFGAIDTLDIMGTTSGYTPEVSGTKPVTTKKTKNDISLDEMAPETTLKPVESEAKHQEITETELLEFDKMFDDFEKSKIVSHSKVVRVRPDISVQASVKAPSGKNSPFKGASVQQL